MQTGNGRYIRMAGIGAIIRTFRGLAEGRKLNIQKDELGQLANNDVLSLVPESFKSCADLRFKIAQIDITAAKEQAQLNINAVNSFEDIRKAGLSKTMENASRETVTRDEMIRLIHTIDEFARSANASIEEVSKQSKQMNEMTLKQLNRHDERFSSMQKEISDHSNSLRVIEELSAKLENVDNKFISTKQNLDMSIKGLRMWLMAAAGLSVVEGACIIYLLVR